MKTTKTITVKENQSGFEVRNNYETIAFVANIREAYEAAKAIDPTKKVIVKSAW